MMDWDEVSRDLRQPLNPDAVKPPPQGKYGDYVDALHVIREANRIFGEAGWNYDVRQLTCTNDAKSGDKHFVGYYALVQVNVDGVLRTDVGHGSGVSKNHGDAHDSAVKEAVTDALKRALRTFGNTFGLALYEKDKNKREVGVPFNADESYARIKAAIWRQDTISKLDALWAQKSVKDIFAQFNDDDKAALLQEFTTRMGELGAE